MMYTIDMQSCLFSDIHNQLYLAQYDFWHKYLFADSPFYALHIFLPRDLNIHRSMPHVIHMRDDGWSQVVLVDKDKDDYNNNHENTDNCFKIFVL